MRQHAFLVTLRKQTATDDGVRLFEHWHEAKVEGLSSPTNSFRPIVFMSEATKPTRDVHGVPTCGATYAHLAQG